MKHLRNWCARVQWDGHEPFLFGTVQAASELEAERAIEAAWAEICPHPVRVLAIIPGMVVFHGD